MSQQDTTSNNQACMYSQILPTHAHHTIMFSSIHRKYYTLKPLPPKLDSVIPSRPIRCAACVPCSACLHTFHVFLALPLLLSQYSLSRALPVRLALLTCTHSTSFLPCHYAFLVFLVSRALQYLGACPYGLGAVIWPKLPLSGASQYMD
jgi:hypothetical protein